MLSRCVGWPNPVGEARDDYDIFRRCRGGWASQAFTEGRDSRDWLATSLRPTRRALAMRLADAPDFDEFWRRGELALPSAPADGGFLRAFRDDPLKQPLPTPSGKIEIHSKTIAGFGYDDCPGHPAWLPSTGNRRRIASRCRWSPTSRRRGCTASSISAVTASPGNIAGREAVRLNPDDAARAASPTATSSACSTIAARAWPPRGRPTSCPAWCSCRPAPGTIRPADDEEIPLCVHGNPNVLTRDVGTSRLAQGCCGRVTVVECEKYEGAQPSSAPSILLIS